VLELLRDAAQDIPAYRILLAVAAKESDHPLGLLKGLNQPVEQDAVEAPVAAMQGSLLHEHRPQISWITAANRDIKGRALG